MSKVLMNFKMVLKVSRDLKFFKEFEGISRNFVGFPKISKDFYKAFNYFKDMLDFERFPWASQDKHVCAAPTGV